MASRTSRTTIKKQNTFAGLLHKHEEVSAQRCNVQWIKQVLFTMKHNSWIGLAWDVFQVILSLIACAIYVSETYLFDYTAIRVYDLIELVITQFFMMDFLLTWFISGSSRHFFGQFMTWIDIATILPVYISFVVSDNAAPNLSILRFLRILRLVRILRTFRMLGGFSGVKRQSITLSLAMLSLIFLAAGIVNILENELNSIDFDCQYINSLTQYEPSCEASYPTFDDPSCDCKEHHCEPLYRSHDSLGKPSDIKCTDLPFFDSLYFIVITIYPVGYGSMVVNNYSRAAIIVLIITSIIVIQMQVNKLSQLYSMNSPYRAPYEKSYQDKHVILCGFVHDKEKLARFLREFFHPDRQNPRMLGFHLVVLGPVEPTPELEEVISNPLFEGRLVYIIGSALNIQDLVKAQADSAVAIMFLSNPELDNVGAVLDDAATVLRTLSVINFNPELECLVQVLQASDRDLLKDSDADLVLCMDDYKTTLQARNAMCPGLATFVENLFHSSGNSRLHSSCPPEHWMSEYSHGIEMELYYIAIDKDFFAKLNFNWRLLVEAVYVEFECLLLGVCRSSDMSLVLNPGKTEFQNYSCSLDFFKSYTTGVLLAPDDASANAIAFALTDPHMTNDLIERLISAEDMFAVRTQVPPKAVEPIDTSGKPIRRLSLTLGSNIVGSLGDGRTSQQLSLSSINISQSLLDADFGPDFTRRKSFRMKQNKIAGQENDSDSSDEMGERHFLGFVDTDSDEGYSEAEEVDSLATNDLAGMGSPSSTNTVTTPTGQSEGHTEKLTFKGAVERVIKERKGERKSGFDTNAWINVIRALNIHGDLEVVDDVNNLGLLKTRRPSMSDKEEYFKKKKFNKSAKHVKSFKSSVKVTMALTSAPTPSTSTKKNKLSFRGASKKIKNVGIFHSSNKPGISETSVLSRGSDSKIENKIEKDEHSSSSASLSMSQRLNGFKKKKSSSSFDDATISNYNSECAAELDGWSSVSQVSKQSLDSQGSWRSGSSSYAPLSSATVGSSALLIKDEPSGGKSGHVVSSLQLHDRNKHLFPARPLDSLSEVHSKDSADDDVGDDRDNVKYNDNSKRNLQSASSNKKRFDVLDSFEVVGETDVAVPEPHHVDVDNAITGCNEKVISKPISNTKKFDVLESFDSPNPDTTISCQPMSFPSNIGTGGKESDNSGPSVHRKKFDVLESFDDSKIDQIYEKQKHVEWARATTTQSPRVDPPKHTNSLDNVPNFGLPSNEVSNASALRGHIIVIGCVENVLMFIQELRKPRQDHISYHSILIVDEFLPAKWDHIKKHFDDVYFLYSRARSSGKEELEHMNIQAAHSLVLLASRERNSLDEATNIDSAAIFMYLKLHTFVPRHVFFTVELFLSSSIGMLNSVIQRHLKNSELETEQVSSNASGLNTGIAVSRRRRRSSAIKVQGSSDTALLFEAVSWMSLSESHSAFNATHQSMVLRDIAEQRQSRKKLGQSSNSWSSSSNKSIYNPETDDKLDTKRKMSEKGSFGNIFKKDNSVSGTNMTDKEREVDPLSKAKKLWGVDGSHHMLPVYAASLVYVPTGFDSIFCNSFFGTYTPQMCEQLICGQGDQLMHNIEVPESFWSRQYGDLFRALNCRSVIAVALYRYQHPITEAAMSYVYTNPTMNSVLGDHDRVLVFGNSDIIKKAVTALSLPIVALPGDEVKYSMDPTTLKAPTSSTSRPSKDSSTMPKFSGMQGQFSTVVAPKVHP